MLNNLSIDNMLATLPLSIWWNSVIVILTCSVMAYIAYRLLRQSHAMNGYFKQSLSLIWQSAKSPLIILFSVYLFSFSLDILAAFFPLLMNNSGGKLLLTLVPYLLRLVGFVSLLWFVWRVLTAVEARLQERNLFKEGPVYRIMLPLISNSLRAAIIFLVVNLLIPEIGLTGLSQDFLQKIARIVLIGILGWLFFQIANATESIILHQFATPSTARLEGRKIRNNVLLFKRLVLTIAVIIVISASLLVFENMRRLGEGLLTTAGLLSALGAFAAKESISRAFAGLQLAFTQPIRIGDVVIIDNELGEVEEISLSYVVIKVWDLRRLILPTDYIMQKGIQNLTRNSTQLLGTAFIHADYTLPVHELREKFFEVINESNLWDGKIGLLQVTDVKENTLEIRALVSAEDGNKLWNLRCEIREKLISYIVTHFPDCLPQSRAQNKTIATTFLTQGEREKV